MVASQCEGTGGPARGAEGGAGGDGGDGGAGGAGGGGSEGGSKKHGGGTTSVELAWSKSEKLAPHSARHGGEWRHCRGRATT